MKKEKKPIRIPRDRARRARSLKAAAVAVVNRAYLEIVASGKSHDQALSELAGVSGVSKNGVRNWLSNTNRPGRRAAEAIILKYDRELSSRFGLLPLDPPDPAAGAQAQGELVERFPDPPPPAGPPTLAIAAAALDGIRLLVDGRLTAILDEILQVKKENATLRAGIQKLYDDRDNLGSVVEALRSDFQERTSVLRRDLASVGVLASKIKESVDILVVDKNFLSLPRPAGPPPNCLCPIVPVDDGGVPSSPPADGSDRSEPGLEETKDKLGG